MPREPLTQTQIEELIADAKQYVDDDFTIDVRPGGDCSNDPWLHYRAPHGRISLAMGECRTDLRLISVEHLKALTGRAAPIPLDTIEAPATLLPLIEYLPKGCLVLFEVAPMNPVQSNGIWPTASETMFAKYKAALQNHFVGQMFSDTPAQPQQVRDTVRQLRAAAVAADQIAFVFQPHPTDTNHALQEADYSFRIREGWADSLIIELGKCRRAELIPRTHALIFKG